VRVGVVDAHHHRVRDLARSRRPAVAANIANNDGTVAKAELRAVVLADPYALDKSKCGVYQATASRTSG
jgi:hypothetical protein